METKEKDLSQEKFNQILKKASENKTEIKQFTIKIDFITDTGIKEEDCSPKLFKEAKREYVDKIDTSIRKWVDENIEADSNLALKNFEFYSSKFFKISEFEDFLKEIIERKLDD